MKYLIGLLVTIFVIIIIIIKLLTGGGGRTPIRPVTLTDYANTGTIMRMTIRNPIQASENHRQVQIDVGRDEASLTVYKGYEGEILSSNTFPMNSTAYGDFLAGLSNSAGYTLGKTGIGTTNGAGFCATGYLYNYQIVDPNGKMIQDFWSGSCSSGTYKGIVGTTQQMFEAQIPNYNTLTQNIGL